MIDASLAAGVHSISAGKWAVGVSGGADSVTLLHLLHQLRSRHADLRIVVAHFNHQTRGPASDADEAFVRELCERLHVPCRVGRRDEFEPDRLSNNPSARLRMMRFAHFRRVVEQEELCGVILAHHADDQAETVFQRLLRGGSYSSLSGIAARAHVHQVEVLRPLLQVRRATLRQFLSDASLNWREDASNTSPKYFRNRLRMILQTREDLVDALLDLSRACAGLKHVVRRIAPTLDRSFRCPALDDLPTLFARESARRWLRSHHVPANRIDRAMIDRLRTMCADAGSANRQHFPGGVRVRRRGGVISVES